MTLPTSKTKSEEKTSPSKIPIRRITYPEQASPAMKETLLMSKIKSKDKGSPAMRKMKSTPNFKKHSSLAVLNDLEPKEFNQAISLLRAMSIFEPTDIRERYLTTISASYSSKTGMEEETLSDYPTKPVELRMTMNLLLRKRLISLQEYRLGLCIKPEVREEVLAQLAKMQDVFDLAFRTVVNALYSLWPSMQGPQREELEWKDYSSYNLWGRRDELVNHVRALEMISVGAEKEMRPRFTRRRFIVLLTEAAWFQFERAYYNDAQFFGRAAYEASNWADMVPRSLLANMHRTNAAIAYELGQSYWADLHVNEFILLYRESFPQPDPHAVRAWRHGFPTADWTLSKKAIFDSGLLAAAPDGVERSPWGFEEVRGLPYLAPFLSLRFFGWMNYAEGNHEDAAKCFLQALGSRKSALGVDDRKESLRKGELLYALGIVRNAQGRFDESLNYFKRALAQFKATDRRGSSTAKTQYKIALHYMYMKEWVRASVYIREALDFYKQTRAPEEYLPHLARVFLQVARIQYGVVDDEAGESLKLAFWIRDMVAPNDPRQDIDLVEGDFDAEIVVWAR